MSKKTQGDPRVSNLNPSLRRPKPQRPSVHTLVTGILAGDRVRLGQAITLVESTRPEDRTLAGRVVDACLPHSGQSIRIGITGSPGVGKSTFIEGMGLLTLAEGRRVAVLAIDPSSQRSHGSILGDKTRMEKLGQQEAAFIRPSPTGSTLGGVARKTRETIILCEAAGFNTLLVETVGVGQSETAVHGMVDFFLLLLLPGAGDELQGIKRGIVEMADLFAINKAEGDNAQRARQSAQAYRNALHLFPAKYPFWTPPVQICSALNGEGMPEIWSAIKSFHLRSREHNHFYQHRQEQASAWLWETITASLLDRFEQHPEVLAHRKEIERKVLDGKITPAQGADILLGKFFPAPD